MAEENLLNADCILHRKICNYFCQYSKCTARVLCEKCVRDHEQNHPKQFIYEVDSLAQLHAINRVDKLKENLVNDKLEQQNKIAQFYSYFEILLKPIIDRVLQFQKQSMVMIKKQLNHYLSKNKFIIEKIKVDKTITNKIISNPTKLLNQTTAEVQLINKRENQLKENSQYYYWYRNSTEEMLKTIIDQLKSLNDVAINLLDNCNSLQIGKYQKKIIKESTGDEKTFFLKFITSHQSISHGDQNQLQMTIIKLQKQLQKRQNEIKRIQNELKEKNKKNEQLLIKIQDLKEQLVKWQQKADREERQRKQAILRQRKIKIQHLIKNGIIGENQKSICLAKKKVDNKYFSLILQEVPKPLQLDFSAHNLTKEQLQTFLTCSTVQILKMNFTFCDEEFLEKVFISFPSLSEVQLNSTEIDDDKLVKISQHFSKHLKRLQIMDNKITDEGLEKMFFKFKGTLQSLHLSYNSQLTSRSMDTLGKYSFDLKILHVAKILIKTKGGISIGRYLKNIKQLYLGGTGIQKEGFLSLCRGCPKLKRLSLVSNELTPDMIFQIMDGIPGLQWLDVSYCGFSDEDWQKIDKLKMFNENLELIHNN